ncbi:hypothetical protein AB6C44_05440 [Vibrio splendidus]
MFIFNSTKPIINGAALCPELAAFLAENKSDFERKLIPDLSHIDHMAHNPNGIVIKNVSYNGGEQYQLDYSFDWEVFRGCSDMNEEGVERGSVLFTLNVNGVLEIAFPAHQERDTHDEF